MARNFTLTRTLTLTGLLSALTLNLTPAWAAPMGPTQVSAMAAAWAARSAGFQEAQISSVHALAWEAAEPVFYLVSLNQGGWILASGDDALRPVVGWSAQGLLDGELPPALVTRLQEEERAVLTLRATGGSCAENQA
ncbi:MAG: Spi family protease inhibitor, partial [Candidatus Delongbacteria bacterium]